MIIFGRLNWCGNGSCPGVANGCLPVDCRGEEMADKAFGITNRPDELIHLTLDALERKKY